MAKLIIVLDVDLDPKLVDPHEVAEEVLDDHDHDGNRIEWPGVVPYADCPTTFVAAAWADRRDLVNAALAEAGS